MKAENGKVELKLYVTGNSRRSESALQSLKKIVDHHPSSHYEIEVIDAQEHPERAEQDKVLVTPLLIRTSPPPVLRIVGDLTDMERVLVVLGLNAPTWNGPYPQDSSPSQTESS